MRYVLKNKNISDKGTFEFYKGLLNMELNKYEFKILTMVLALKNDNKIYSGTLKDMCEFLGVSRSSNKIIKDAIEEMSKKDLLIYVVKGYTWTLIFNDKSLKDKTILDMDLAWLDTIKKYRADKKGYEVDWSNLLKVFIYLIDNNNNIIDTGKIQTSTNLSASIVKKALAAINDINEQGGFGCGFTIEREYYNNHTFSEKPQGFYLYKYEDINKEIVYIGQTVSLTQRIQQHTQDKLQDFSGIVYYVECGSKEEMDFLEKVLINYYKPKFNIIHKDRNDLTTKLININLNWQFYTKITD